MHLYLMRHAEAVTNLPDWNDPLIFDAPLTERGHKQAAAAAQWISENLPPIDHLYSSTMMRTRETVDDLEEAIDKRAIFDDRIREIGNCRRDHSPITADEIVSYNDHWIAEKPYLSSNSDPNGETLMHFRARLGIFLQEMIEKHQGEVIFVVCHGFVIDVLFDLCQNVPIHRHCETWTANTGICHLEYVEHPGRERWRQYCHNRVEHLTSTGVGGLGITISGVANESIHSQKLSDKKS